MGVTQFRHVLVVCEVWFESAAFAVGLVWLYW